MKSNAMLKFWTAVFTLVIISCNPDAEDTPSDNNNGGSGVENNGGGGNNGGEEYTIGDSIHTCGATVHNPNLAYGTVTDQEGNVYKTIEIGNQEWMAENLNTTLYRNGDSIATGLSQTEWLQTLNTHEGAWIYYWDDSSYYECPYGKLYNWYACADSRGLCPAGWHIPSKVEWQVLVDYLGDDWTSGDKMKSKYYWPAHAMATPNNESGFSGLPGGYRILAQWVYLSQSGAWWTSTENGANYAWYRSLNELNSHVGSGTEYPKSSGYSVRCVRD